MNALGRRPRIATILLAYGIAGLLVGTAASAIALGAIERIDAAATRLPARAAAIEASLDQAAASLDAAGATATSVTGSLDAASASLSALHDSLVSIAPALREFQAGAATISILGQNPLGRIGDQAGSLAGSVDLLDARLAALAARLPEDATSIRQLGASLTGLGAEVRTLRGTIAAAVESDAAATGLATLRILWLLVTLSLVAPPVAALAVGLELRRRAVGTTAS